MLTSQERGRIEAPLRAEFDLGDSRKPDSAAAEEVLMPMTRCDYEPDRWESGRYKPGRARVPLVPVEASPTTAALAAGGHGSSLNPGKAEQ